MQNKKIFWWSGSYVLILVMIVMWQCGKEFSVPSDALFSFRKSTESYELAYIAQYELRNMAEEMAEDKSSPRSAGYYRRITDTIHVMDSLNRQLVNFIEGIKRDLVRYTTGVDDARFVRNQDSYKLYDMNGWKLHRNYYSEVGQLALHPTERYPDGFAKELLRKLRDYRQRLLKVTSTHYTWTFQGIREVEDYYLLPPECHFYKKTSDLDILMKHSIDKSNVTPDDVGMLYVLFRELQFNEAGETEEAYLERVFGDCSLTDCLERLTAFETDITQPLKDLYSVFVCIGCFIDCPFSSMETVVVLPQIIRKGEPFEYTVRVGAFSYEMVPEVEEIHSQKVKNIPGGVVLRATIDTDSLLFKGRFTSRNKSGTALTRFWEKSVKVTSGNGANITPD